MASLLDLHCHTVHGSSDSELTPQQLAQIALRSGLTACCVTEHNSVWDRHEAERYSNQFGISFLQGMEVTTNLGHILVYGLDRYVSGIHDALTLRRTVLAKGGIMIFAHPFRKLFYQIRFGENGPKPSIPSIEEATAYQVFRLVDEVEVLNGGTAELENYFALRVAEKLGFRGIAGSDAHSTHGVGRFVTVFHRKVTTVAELVQEVKAGRFYPAEAQHAERELLPYTPGTLGSELEERLQAAIAALVSPA